MKAELIWHLAFAISAALAFGVRGQDQQKEIPKPPTKTTTSVWRPVKGDGHFVHFIPREKMKAKRSPRAARQLDPSKLPPAPATLDYAKSIDFPMDLNDTYGDCYYAAICHLHNTLAGNSSTSPTFGLSAIRQRYFILSGGDNGLGDMDVQGEMMSTTRPYQGFVADVPGTSIVDFQYLDTTDPDAVKRAMACFGVVMFTLSVPDNWINTSDTGSVWDVPARPDPANGHAVIWNGFDARGYYKLQTWGTYVWITPAGVQNCDPSGWVVFSAKWFNAKGYAPNGLHVRQLATIWQAAGGNAIPQSVINAFPPPNGPPPPPPSPTPGDVTITLSSDLKAGTYLVGGVKLTREMTLGEVMDLVGKGPQRSVIDDKKRIADLEGAVRTIADAVIGLQKAIGAPDAAKYLEKKGGSRRWDQLDQAERDAWWRRNFPGQPIESLSANAYWQENWHLFAKENP